MLRTEHSRLFLQQDHHPIGLPPPTQKHTSTIHSPPSNLPEFPQAPILLSKKKGEQTMPPQTSCAPCTLTFPTRLALRSHIRRSESHPECDPCHRSFLNDHALATHLAQSRFHNNPAPPTTAGSARMGRRPRHRRRSDRGKVHAEEGGECCDEKLTPSRRELRVPQHKILIWARYPFRRTPRRILPPGHVRALPRPVSAKRLVSAVVRKGPRYLLMLLVMLLVVVGVRGYCERFGCGYVN
ncbi:hypothetical protein VC83_06954 [Pseudogymnoascus destructans]|uniref:C2H2-type domain-containing protein n=1 Tax=Pseudogymnoascus destructans TaxID=655981 RepID=A0A177A5P9_9PEZI|nr:uncharacterized protein VC83_06954 [Pseudogymnoascus destructans]OAF56812.1 hypothetical protein VC83_06954 [Pseudogymnoascus destructans]